MAEIGFYHLTRSSVDAALPALLGRTLAAGERAVVLCGSAERVAALDRLLWEVTEPDWLPHGSAASGEAALQPIWLTQTLEQPNRARFLFLVDGSPIDDETAGFEGWARVFDLFAGDDPASVAQARTRWVAARSAGHATTYWKQGEQGWAKG